MNARALLGFAPFAAFALIERLVGILPGLGAGLGVSLALLGWEAARHRAINLLEAGSATIFAGLVLLAAIAPRTWSVWEVRLYVDGGLALIVFLSVALRRPFTLQKGRRAVAPEVARSGDFLRYNSILSSVWGLAFAGLAAIDLYMMMQGGDMPDRRGILLTLLVLGGAVRFTQIYLKRIRSAA